MRVTIKGRNKGLCGTCKHSTIVKGKNNEEYFRCESISFRSANEAETIPFEVKECTSYHRKGTMDLHTMSEVAWILEVDKRSGVAGFIDNVEWNHKHPKDKVLPYGIQYDD